MGVLFWLGGDRTDLNESPKAFIKVPPLLQLAAALSFIAALTHAMVVREHFAEWWGYGAFFVAVTAAQLVYAGLILIVPTRRVALIGIAGNAAVLALYTVSRTVGIPFLGPHAGEVEAIGRIDMVCGWAEFGLIIALAVLAKRSSSPAPPRRRIVALAAGLMALAVVGMPGGAPAATGHDHDHASDSFVADDFMAMDEPMTEDDSVDMADMEEPAPEPDPTFPPCIPESTGPGAPIGAGTPSEARAIVASHMDTIWLHDLASGSDRQLLRNNEDCWAGGPVFKDEHSVTFSYGDAIYDLDVVTGKLSAVLENRSASLFEWNHDGTSIAYVTDTNDGSSLSISTDGKARQLRLLPLALGRCGGEDDEGRLAWSPDGSRLLLTMTWLESEGTMFVIDSRTGEDIVKPIRATMGRWSPDSRTIYYRDYAWEGAIGWHALDVATGKIRDLSLADGAMRVEVSPSGNKLVYDTSGSDPTVYFYDLTRDAGRKIATGHANAQWISDDVVIASGTKSCGSGLDMECMQEWMEDGSVDAIRLDGTVTPMKDLTSTWTVDVLFASPEAATPKATEVPAPTPSATTSPEPSAEPTPTESPIPTETPTPTESPTPTDTPSPTETPTPDPSSNPAA